MSSEIKINNPSEVMSCVKRINAILALYQEDCTTEFNQVASFENYIYEAKQTVSSRKNGKLTALAQYQKSENDSEAARTSVQEIQAQIKRCDEHLSNIYQCQNEFISIRQGQSSIIKECTQLSDVSKILSSKIETLITKIVEAK